MLLRILERVAVYRRAKGKRGGIWTGVALATMLIRWHQRREAREQVSLIEELQPGESILITHTTQPRG
jgi:hypothetical protein